MMKPTLRDRRSSTTGVIVKLEPGTKWTFAEKKSLLDGLHKYGVRNVDKIQTQYLPQRQMSDINSYLKKMKFKAKKVMGAELAAAGKKAPIEIWLSKTEAICQNDHDYSPSLSRIFSMFGNLEPHDTLQGNAPDWNSLYKNLASLLRGVKPSDVTPANAMVILELIEGLAKNLARLDVTKQRKLMLFKYKLLRKHTNLHDKKLSFDTIHQALESDPLIDFAPENKAFASATQTANHSTADGARAPTSLSEQPSTSNPMNIQSPQTLSFVEVPSMNIQSSQTSSSNGIPAINIQQSSLTNQQSPEPLSTNQTPVSQEAQPSSTNRSAASMSTPSSPPKNPTNPKIKKTPLYSLNPYCIPIKYLRMMPKNTQSK